MFDLFVLSLFFRVILVFIRPYYPSFLWGGVFCVFYTNTNTKKKNYIVCVILGSFYKASGGTFIFYSSLISSWRSGSKRKQDGSRPVPQWLSNV